MKIMGGYVSDGLDKNIRIHVLTIVNGHYGKKIIKKKKSIIITISAIVLVLCIYMHIRVNIPI